MFLTFRFRLARDSDRDFVRRDCSISAVTQVWAGNLHSVFPWLNHVTEFTDRNFVVARLTRLQGNCDPPASDEAWVAYILGLIISCRCPCTLFVIHSNRIIAVAVPIHYQEWLF